MPLPAALRDRMDDWIRQNRGRIIGLTTELVRISSETDPPGGNEQAAQEFLAGCCVPHAEP